MEDKWNKNQKIDSMSYKKIFKLNYIMFKVNRLPG